MILILRRQYFKMQFSMYSKRNSNMKRNITFVKNWHLPRARERTHCIKRLCGFCTLDTAWPLAIPLPHLNIDDKFQMFFWSFHLYSSMTALRFYFCYLNKFCICDTSILTSFCCGEKLILYILIPINFVNSYWVVGLRYTITHAHCYEIVSMLKNVYHSIRFNQRLFDILISTDF